MGKTIASFVVLTPMCQKKKTMCLISFIYINIRPFHSGILEKYGSHSNFLTPRSALYSSKWPCSPSNSLWNPPSNKGTPTFLNQLTWWIFKIPATRKSFQNSLNDYHYYFFMFNSTYRPEERRTCLQWSTRLWHSYCQHSPNRMESNPWWTCLLLNLRPSWMDDKSLAAVQVHQVDEMAILILITPAILSSCLHVKQVQNVTGQETCARNASCCLGWEEGFSENVKVPRKHIGSRIVLNLVPGCSSSIAFRASCRDSASSRNLKAQVSPSWDLSKFLLLLLVIQTLFNQSCTHPIGPPADPMQVVRQNSGAECS